MLIDFKKSMAYICPFCSGITSKNIDIFDFSGKSAVGFQCSSTGCREDCISIRQKASKYIVNIECPICGDSHSFSISADRFWAKKLMTLSCPISGIEIFFLGSKNDVEDALAEKAEDFSDFIDEEFDLGEEEILYGILDRIHELREKHKISCVCGNENVEFSMLGGNLALVCTRCGRTKIIETSEENLEKLLKAHSLIISN